jgi:hypothetical protein
VSVTVDAQRLRQEIARRGWGGVDLARAARLSPATVSAALSGRPIAATSLNLMVKALASAPVDALIDRLLGGPEKRGVS